MPASKLIELAPGLWRWSAPHPDWEPDPVPDSPADWPREVGSVLYDAADATVFVDPFVPDGDSVWHRLNQHIVLTSHGAPVLAGGRAALSTALGR